MRVTAVPNRDSLSRRIGSLKRQMKTAEPHERRETCRCPAEVCQSETAPDMNGRTTFFSMRSEKTASSRSSGSLPPRARKAAVYRA